jgi:hypothetical protein
MLISVLWALVTLCIVVGVIYLILWVLGSLGIVIPANIVKVIWVILVLLAIIFIVEHFFSGSGHSIRI